MPGMSHSSQVSSRFDSRRQWAIWPGILVALLLAVLGCGTGKEPIAIRVGDTEISLAEFERSFWTAAKKDSSLRADSTGIHRHARSLADQLLIDAIARVEDPELEPMRADRMEEFKERLYVEALRKEMYGAAYNVGERDLKDAWEKLGRRLRLNYLAVRTEAEANEIRAALQQGAIFSKIAEQRSLDERSRAGGGDLGWISYLDLDPLTRDDIFALQKGEISRPILYAGAFQLFQVVDEQANDGRGTLKEETLRLTQGLQMKLVRRAKEQYEQNLLQKYHYTVDPAEVAFMTVLLRERTRGVNRGEDLTALGAKDDGTAVATQGTLPWTGPPVPPADTSRTVATFDPPDGRVTPLLLFDQLLSHPMPTWPKFETGADVEELLRELVLERLEIREALARKIDTRPEIQREIAEQLRDVRGRQWTRNHVRPKLRPSEEELRAYYDSHLAEFATAETRRFVAINVRDQEVARKARALLVAGKATEEIRRAVAAGDTSWATTGDSGTPPLTYGRSPMLDDVIFNLPMNGVSEPLPVGSTWTVAKVIEINPFVQKPFEEVKIALQSRIVDQRLGPWMKQRLAQARSEHPVTIDWAVVDRARPVPAAGK